MTYILCCGGSYWVDPKHSTNMQKQSITITNLRLVSAFEFFCNISVITPKMTGAWPNSESEILVFTLVYG